jgi:type I restriction enzyme, R subunit
MKQDTNKQNNDSAFRVPHSAFASNFDFLPDEFAPIADSARKAEQHILGDPRAACFHARFALEAAVHWLYRHDPALRTPYDQRLGALLHEPSFQNLAPEAIFHKARLIWKIGNQAVHHPRPVRQYDAQRAVQELHHICYWLTRAYTPHAPRDGAAWSDERIPRPVSWAEVVPRQQLEAMAQQLADKHAAELRQQQERDALNAELQALREQLAAMRAAAQQQPDPHDYSEAETRHYLIDVDLRRAGWPLDQSRAREYRVTGMPTQSGVGYVDYVLWGDDGKPLALVEAKKATAAPDRGRQQAKLYADCLEAEHGQRPLIFYTNGYTTWLWDDRAYPPRPVAGFYKKAELARLIRRRASRRPLDAAQVKPRIIDRYYQQRAISSIFEHFTQARRKALLVMATGAGKTRTAVALVDALQRANWVKRALFLADRLALVNQAVNAFKQHLPESSPVNLVTDKDAEGRVYVCTYPTMMGLIDAPQTAGTSEARFGVGHFDLVIIDEAHRSVYQQYGAIFEYFDALLVGLTATPREQVARNTYELFDLEPGVPTDAYELDQAVRDGYLVPPRVEQVDLRFPREGIDYDSLSDEEQAQWESLDWGDDADDRAMPRQVNASAINDWLFNRDTVDKVLQHLMERGHRVEAGDRLGKTIIFARNHAHAQFIEDRFNHHYPEQAGSFARVIDHYADHAQSLIEAFSDPDKAPHIAISVDMLDTGIDIHEVLNLVFFKPVYSKIKFWQMLGRGTRLCPNLFGPGNDKQDFRVFDFCFNFDFFRENPQGIEAAGGAPLGARLFRARVQLLGRLQTDPGPDPDAVLREALIDRLYGEVAAMNRDNFLVRMHLAAVEHFQRREAWDHLTEADRDALQREVAGLPGRVETDALESRLFDLTVLRLQLALVAANPRAFEHHRQRVVEMAGLLLQGKTSIPAVAAQAAYLARLQEPAFWKGIDLAALEDLRLRLRGLVPLLDRKQRKIVYTNFQDEVLSVREESPVFMPKMTSAQYEKKVKAYLRTHLDNIVIQRLRANRPLTNTDLESLEAILVQIGEDDGQTLLNGLLKRSGAPSLAHFVRSLVGLDRAAAQKAFAVFLQDRSLTPPQMRFIEMLIDQLTARGVMDAAALYEAPFSDLHSGGPEAVFAGRQPLIDAIFETLDAVQPRQQASAG